MELAPYGPGGVRLVVDVDVVARGVLPQLPAQLPTYLLAAFGEAIVGRIEGHDHGPGVPPAALVDVRRRGGLYALDLERAEQLRPVELDLRLSAARAVPRSRDLFFSCLVRRQGSARPHGAR